MQALAPEEALRKFAKEVVVLNGHEPRDTRALADAHHVAAEQVQSGLTVCLEYGLAFTLEGKVYLAVGVKDERARGEGVWGECGDQ